METAFTSHLNVNTLQKKQHWAPFFSLLGAILKQKKTAKMLNFGWLDIDSCLQINASKWLDISCDSTPTGLDQDMTRLEKSLDDSDLKGLWLCLDKYDSGVKQNFWVNAMCACAK